MPPSVSSVSGSLIDGSPITISGSGFGSHDLDIESLAANIEAGTPGTAFSKTGWLNNGGSYPWEQIEYSSAQAHSGSKSLRAIMDDVTNYNGVFRHALANPVLATEKCYVTWWVRPTHTASGQWKNLRLSGNDTIIDGAKECVMFNWWGVNDSQIRIDPGTGNDQSFFPGNANFHQTDNVWKRQELLVTASATNTTDGSVILALYTGSAYQSWTSPAVKTHVAGGDTYSYVLWQNYIGNSMTDMTAYFDDVYIQKTFARVEIADTPTWAARTVSEIQIPTVWADGSITVTVQRGGYGVSDTKYLYVVDSTNVANANGHAITFGQDEGGGGIPQPAPRGYGLRSVRT